MNTTRRSVRLLLLLVSAVIVGCQPPDASARAAEATLDRVTPETVGLSSERIARLHDAMQELVDDGRLAGITTMIARNGRIADFQTFGFRDMESADPMQEDAIFRIYSMSKPITGVALMILYEEGAFRLSDPVARYLPELSSMQVAAAWNGDEPVLEAPNHRMTIRELMTHTAGLAYGIGDSNPVDRAYSEAGVLATDQTLADMIDKLAELPLRQQPGSRWSYSASVDVQGRLVEVLSGQPFDVFLQERIFDPLGMVDTGFHVPAEDHDRFAQVYGYREGSLYAPAADDSGAPRPFLDPTTFFSGGGGLVSTTMDYLRFSQMLLNGGELDGVRILSPTTVEIMTRNHLPREMGEYAPGLGFGLGFRVVTDPVEGGGYSVGEYSWGGAAGTWFWIDPAEELIFVGMIQQFGQGRPAIRSIAHRLTYQALLQSNVAEATR